MKDAVIVRLTQEKDLEQKKNSALIGMAEAIGDHVMKAHPHLKSKVPEQFPLAMHYVRALVDLVLEEDTIRMPKPKNPEEEAERAKAVVVRKIASYEGLLQALQEELKKVDHALNICTTPEALIKVKTLEEDNAVQKAMKDDTLGHAERLTLVKQKHEALAAAQEPHKERLDELGKLITQNMDALEGKHTAMSSIMLVLQNEKGEVTQDELESIIVDIPE
ncbi:hypothetical protein KI387_027197 [Taxus chinensis]|uniref:Uncharacterized protein n=1 Tax=Taxus chinensis TaxID=29808 RepID=A0AA38FX20_TAXCH|nr:hypothetical protein KI387_027197 [Taxus chinensis]